MVDQVDAMVLGRACLLMAMERPQSTRAETRTAQPKSVHQDTFAPTCGASSLGCNSRETTPFGIGTTINFCEPLTSGGSTVDHGLSVDATSLFDNNSAWGSTLLITGDKYNACAVMSNRCVIDTVTHRQARPACHRVVPRMS